jgi:hypothetical protein
MFCEAEQDTVATIARQAWLLALVWRCRAAVKSMVTCMDFERALDSIRRCYVVVTHRLR